MHKVEVANSAPSKVTFGYCILTQNIIVKNYNTMLSKILSILFHVAKESKKRVMFKYYLCYKSQQLQKWIRISGNSIAGHLLYILMERGIKTFFKIDIVPAMNEIVLGTCNFRRC